MVQKTCHGPDTQIQIIVVVKFLEASRGMIVGVTKFCHEQSVTNQ